MSIRKRRWTTRKGDVKEAWVVGYTDSDSLTGSSQAHPQGGFVFGIFDSRDATRDP
jgi:hypothetical protein